MRLKSGYNRSTAVLERFAGMKIAEQVHWFHFDCPRCGERCRIAAEQRGELIHCGSCGLEFLGPVFPLGPGDSLAREAALCEVPALPWGRWRRPVSKVFTRRERSYSLHHLMMHQRRRAHPDLCLTPRARRLFEFYCGACGHLQDARVWDIATQTPCQWCGELMIVPSPAHPRRMTTSSTSPAELFCPQCGQPAPLSDPRRRRNSYCDHCAIWF